MPEDTADKGNPNVFTTFFGQYRLILSEGVVSTNEIIMLTCINTVQFLGDIVLNGYLADSVVAMLPEPCIPESDVILPVIITRDETKQIGYITVTSQGDLKLAENYETGIVRLSGTSFNISNNYYKDIE